MKKAQIVVKRFLRRSSQIKYTSKVRYMECQKNHAASVGGYAVDGCREFMASGEEGSNHGFVCAACGCHRNLHRKEEQLVSNNLLPFK